MNVSQELLDRLIAEHLAMGRTIDEMNEVIPDPPDFVTLNLTPADNVQAALDSLSETGGLINLAEGVYPFAPVLHFKNKLVTFNGVTDDRSKVSLKGFTAGINTGNVSFHNLSFVTPVGTAHVALGADRGGMKTVEEIPVGFTFTDVDFIGPCRRAISANCAFLLVDNCNARNYKVVGQDSQGIIGWNGSRNHIIRRSSFEAAGENIMYGGSDAALEEMYPKDVLIEDCTLTKVEEWKTANYNMKANFETKNIIGLIFRRNKINGNWKQAWGQAPAIVLKSANQENSNPNARTENAVIENNLIENVGTYFLIIGKDDGPNLSGVMKNVVVRNNLCRLMNAEPDGRAFSVDAGPVDLWVDHNTFFDNRHSAIEFFGAIPPPNFKYTNNVAMHGKYGIWPNPNSMNADFFKCNAFQIKDPASTQPQVKLAATNAFYPDIHADLSAHVTTDGLPVGVNA